MQMEPMKKYNPFYWIGVIGCIVIGVCVLVLMSPFWIIEGIVDFCNESVSE